MDAPGPIRPQCQPLRSNAGALAGIERPTSRVPLPTGRCGNPCQRRRSRGQLGCAAPRSTSQAGVWSAAAADDGPGGQPREHRPPGRHAAGPVRSCGSTWPPGRPTTSPAISTPRCVGREAQATSSTSRPSSDSTNSRTACRGRCGYWPIYHWWRARAATCRASTPMWSIRSTTNWRRWERNSPLQL